MRQTVGAMPPSPAAPVAEPKVGAFESWVSSGMPAGQCQSTGGGAGGGGGGGNPAYDGGLAGLPCDVAAVVANKCASCHRTPATGGATFALLSRSDFLAPSTIPNKNRAQQSQVRLASPSNPMPPMGSAAVTSAEHTSFDGWVNAGTPAGNCGTVDAGLADAGPSPTVCSSNVFWTQATPRASR